MNNRFKVWSLMVLVTLNISCNGFLDKMPSNAVPELDAMTNLDEAKQVVFGIYSSFKNPDLYTGSLTILPDLQSDYLYSVQEFTNTYANIYNWDIKSTDPLIEHVYAGLYFIVARCNFFLDHASEVESTLKLKTDKEFFEKCKGDVYFARALAYSEIIKIFCKAYDPATADTDLGVSIVVHFREDEDKIPLRSSLKKSYEQVLSDLELAKKYIPKSRNGSDSEYFTPGVVSSLYSRVYLYMREWELAAKYATEVIDNNVYKLSDATIIAGVHNGAYVSEYQLMWIFDKSDEIIWKVAMNNIDRTGALGTRFLGYDYVAYLPDYVPAAWVLALYSNQDGRYQALFEQIQTGYHHGLSWPLLMKYPGNPDIDAGGRRVFTNMPKVFRLSEQYLIRAEAYYNMGGSVNEMNANQDLTTLLRRRILNYGVSSASGDNLFKAIKNERVKELYLEGFRLADLKRWGDGFTRTPQKNTVDGPNRISVTKSNVMFTWPIPKHELDAHPEIQPNPSN